jgi:hypothetical protein
MGWTQVKSAGKRGPKREREDLETNYLVAAETGTNLQVYSMIIGYLWAGPR